MFYIKKLFRYRYTYILLGITSLIFALIITNIISYNSKYSQNENSFKVVILKYEIDGNLLKLTAEGKEKLIINYYFTSKEEKEYYCNNLMLGDKYLINGSLNKPSVNTNIGLFNYRKYLYNHHIYYILQATSLTKINSNTSLLMDFKNRINKRIINITKTKGYLKTFILGDKTLLDKDILSTYQTVGISHLFSISGMHIMLFASIILFFMRKVSYNNFLNYIVTIIFLLIYMFLTGVSSSVLRATLMFILFAINKCFNLRIKSINIMMVLLVIVISINPFIIYDIGFIFSYTITLSLIIVSSKIKHIKNKLFKSFYTSVVCFIVSFPIVIYNFYSINILSIILNIILIPYVTLIIFPLSLITFIFPFMDNILNILIVIMEYITKIVNKDIFILILGKPSIIMLILYIISSVLFLYKTKYVSIFIVLLVINILYIDTDIKINYLNVGQGDSILIENIGYKNILIDTGGIISYPKENWQKKKEDYSIAKSVIIPTMKMNKISKLDYLIITHGDNDHMGEAINLVNNFKVENVIFNCGEYNDLEKELINVLEKKNINYYSCIKELNIDMYKLQFLNTGVYDNENDNSSVIYLNYNNYKFLFMGDAGVMREKDILEKYNLDNIDFLKVGHHGSNTSSSVDFINIINPKYSLISVGKNNRYGHPKDSVLDILEDSKIYRTDLDGSIEIKLNKNGYKIRTCPP